MEGQRLTVALLFLFMISAATACRDEDEDVFCFENCTTSDVTQFCNCVVDEVVARNDSGSLSNATLLQEFENEAALILQKNLGCVWCCTFIIIRQFVPQGTVYIVQFHCTKINAAMRPVVITKFWSYTRLLVPFLPNPPGCLNEFAYESPCNCTTSETSRFAASAQRAGDSSAASSASGTTAMVFINTILIAMSFTMLFVF